MKCTIAIIRSRIAHHEKAKKRKDRIAKTHYSMRGEMSPDEHRGENVRNAGYPRRAGYFPDSAETISLPLLMVLRRQRSSDSVSRWREPCPHSRTRDSLATSALSKASSQI